MDWSASLQEEVLWVAFGPFFGSWILLRVLWWCLLAGRW
jgi:hypothetical protein